MIKKTLPVKRYFLTTFVRMKIKKISKIDLSKLTASVYAVLLIDIKLDQDVKKLLLEI